MHLRLIRGSVFIAVLWLTISVGSVSAAAATACEDLVRLGLPNARVDSAEVIAAGAFVPPAGASTLAYANLPAFCLVTATLTPSSDSDIKAEIWLPASGWNGKFQAVGNGGWAGVVPYTSIAAAVAAGYVGAGTDTGHVGGNADFALGHPEKLVDLAYRSIHEMTVHAKTIISAHYGMPARFAYYNGCSQGGRQGLAAAQRYPEDFNGIIAGAAALDSTRMHAARTALNLIVNKNADSVIPPSKYPMIHAAVMNACDARDGLRDGVIESPTLCDFDYAALLCKGGDGQSCLTKGQVESAKAMISPITDPKTGDVLFEGHLVPGSELGWATLGGPQPLGLAVSGLRNVVFLDRSWDYHTLNISTDIDRAGKADNDLFYSSDPNLKPFFDRGGRLLMYHGWSDPQVHPFTSVMYYRDVMKTVGESAANSMALFMVPGMNHCQGGPGADQFDKVGTLERWMEQDIKPDRILAFHMTNGQVDRIRPLCLIGQVAKFMGNGDPNEAANFSCVAEMER